MKKLLFVLFLMIPMGLALHAQSAAAAYPDKPVHLIVGFQPGGTTDALARVIAQKLTEKWRVPVLVETKSGSNGEIAASYVAAAKPDGYTLLVISNAHTTSPSAGGSKPKYDPIKSFSPIVKLGSGPMVLLVKNGLPVKTLPELIALTKASPGKLSAGSSGIGTGPAVAVMMLNKSAGLDLVMVPYQGSGPSLMAVMKGEVDTIFAMASATTAQIEQGTTRAIALTSKLPSGIDVPAAMKIPTIEEATGMKGFDLLDGWYGVIGPAGMPPDIVTIFNKAVYDILSEPEMRVKWARNGLVLDGGPQDSFLKSMMKEVNTFEAMFQNSDLKPVK